ncbi:MAG: hypothetical protein ACM3L9_08795 [Deltaproteobacteria bacterium]
MFNSRFVLTCLTVGVLGLPGLAHAQNASTVSKHVPLQKTIGEARPEVVPSLIVMNAKGATLQGNRLVLTGVSPNSIVFADRPVRAAGHAATSELLQEWSPSEETKDSFAKDPPNATLSVFSKDGQTVKDAVIVMRSPKLEGDQLTFEVDVLEGDIAGADGAASIFIDIIGRPLTPFSFAGVARRTAYRAAWYRGAAFGAAVAAPYYYGPRCGYPPLPPCY